ncbi:major facilitator superfamily domain-containing protein [Xylaria arbuscula]|nr:major facilitator superfamily domain-containing protein [Xylaria arbuscula]
MRLYPIHYGRFWRYADPVWYGSVCYTTAGGFQLTCSKTCRYFPLKISYSTIIFIFEVGSLICGVAPNSVGFIIGCAISGVWAAGVGCGSYNIITFIAEPLKNTSYTGPLGAIFCIGSVSGPLLGVFSSTVSWRWCFYVNLPIGVIPISVIVPPFNAPLVNYSGQSYPWSSSVVIMLLVGVGVVNTDFAICKRLTYVLSATAAALGGGILISTVGLSTLLMIIGAALGILGCGTYCTFGVDTSIKKLIGYEILTRFKLEVCIGSADLSSATGTIIMLCLQSLVGAFWVAGSQVVLVKTLLPSTTLGADPSVVLVTRAGRLRNVLTNEELPDVTLAYTHRIRAIFILSATVVAVALLLSFFLPWKMMDLDCGECRGCVRTQIQVITSHLDAWTNVD